MSESFERLVHGSMGVMPLPPPHTGEAVGRVIREMLTSLGWSGQGDATVTSDSAAVMKVAVQRELSFEWVPCAAHIINNAAKRGLAAVDGDPFKGEAYRMF